MIIDTQSTFKEKEEKRKDKQKSNFNNRHHSKELSDLHNGDSVWVTDLRKYAVVINKSGEPRSYIIKADDGAIYRRNRS